MGCDRCKALEAEIEHNSKLYVEASGTKNLMIEKLEAERDKMYDLLTGDKQSMVKERDELKTELERAKYDLTCYRLDGPLHTELDKLRAHADRLAAQVRHSHACRSANQVGADCTCGVEVVLAEHEKFKGEK